MKFAFFIICTLLLCSQAIPNQLTEQEIEAMKNEKTFEITETSYKRPIKTSFYLDYAYYMNAYSVQIQETKNGEPVADLTLDNLGDSAFQTQFNYNGCVGQNRHLNFDMQQIMVTNEFLSQSTGTPEDNKILVDMAVNLELQRILLFNSHFKMESVKIDMYGDTIVSLSYHNEQPFYSVLSIPESDVADKFYTFKSVSYKNKVYLFTLYGCVIFVASDSEGNLTMKKDNNFDITDLHEMHNVFIHKNWIFIAAGNSGLHYYQIQADGSLGVKKAFVTYTSVRDVKVDVQKKRIYILDNTTGFHGFKYVETESNFTIDDANGRFDFEFYGGVNFDYYLNTFILIQSIHRVDVGYEYHLEIDNNGAKYYINNQFYEDMNIRRVIVKEDYALLVSDTSHRIVYHSIRPENFHKMANSHQYFPDALVRDFQLISIAPDNEPVDGETIAGHLLYNKEYLVGLRLDGISVHKLQRITPMVTCSSTQAIEKSYMLKLNMTDCPDAIYNDDLNEKLTRFYSSPFRYCETTHNFTVTFFGGQISEDDANTGALVAILVVIFIILALLGCFIWYKFQHKKNLELQERQKAELEQRQVDGMKESRKIENMLQDKKRKSSNLSDNQQNFGTDADLRNGSPPNQDNNNNNNNQYDINNKFGGDGDDEIISNFQQQKQENDQESNDLQSITPGSHTMQPQQEQQQVQIQVDNNDNNNNNNNEQDDELYEFD